MRSSLVLLLVLRPPFTNRKGKRIGKESVAHLLTATCKGEDLDKPGWAGRGMSGVNGTGSTESASPGLSTGVCNVIGHVDLGT